MTKKIFTGTMALLLACGAVSAKTLSPAEALERIQQTPAKAHARSLNNMVVSPELVHTSLTPQGDPAVYIFAEPAQHGFVVLSADDVAYPVLGYSDSGEFDADNIPEALNWWLEEYSRQIEYAKAQSRTGMNIRKAAPEGRKAIEPMLKTHWDQGEPYNLLCPKVNGSRTYTGCVATAMAQIMYYWQYPACGKGKITYNDDQGSLQRFTWDFTKHPFEWDKMSLEYLSGQYTDAQANAVANLMKGAGAAVRMSYAEDSSGALSIYTPQALVKYFDYDPNLEYVLRSTVSSTEWDQMMYENLLNVGPVLCGGGSMLGGGHSFVCDGYDGNGYYHFNWGWSQMSDGYFSLDALNPQALGAGGGSGGGYNFTQDGVFGIQPPTGAPAVEKPVCIFQMGNLVGEINGTVLSLELTDDGEAMWVSYNPQTVKVTFGAMVERQDDSNTTASVVQLGRSGFELQPGYGANVKLLNPSFDLAELNLADGTYKVTMVVQNDEKTEQGWIPMMHNHGCSNSVLVRKAGNNYTVESNTIPFYTVNSLEIVDGLYYGCLVKVRYSLSNNTDTEICHGLAPALFTEDGATLAYLGEGKLISIKPGETVEGEFVTDMYLMNSSLGGVYSDTQFILTIFDESRYSFVPTEYFEYVTMHANPGAPAVTISPQLEVEGAKKSFARKGRDILTMYIVDDPSDIHVTSSVTLRSGRVQYPLTVVIFDDDNLIHDMQGQPAYLNKAGDKADIDVHFNFRSAVPGTQYYMQLAYSLQGSPSPIPECDVVCLKVAQPAGINDITADSESSLSFDGTCVSAVDSEASIEIYNLQGVKIAAGKGSLNLSTITRGIYIARSGVDSLKLTL